MTRIDDEIKRALYNVTAEYTLLSYDEFIRESEFASWETRIPLLTITYLSDEDFREISNELPEVVNFLVNDKPNKTICCYFYTITGYISSKIDLITFKLSSFYKRIQSGIKEMIVACLIEEMLTSEIPRVGLNRLSLYEYFPIDEFNTSIYVSKYGVDVYTISGDREKDTVTKNFDPYGLISSRLFQYHQKILASLMGGSL